jgi:uncharacterized protein YjbI with pentapeptide repeats
MSNTPEENLLSLRRQLAEARANLHLIEEREAEFPLSTDIPLLIVKEKRHLLERIAELEQQLAQVAPASPKAEPGDERGAYDQHAKTEREIADDRSRERTLQNYLDKMAELLLKEHLSDPEGPDIVYDIACARTVTALRQLDATRRNLLLGFLRQAGLITTDDPVPLLAEADLRGADLRGALLHRANLGNADLRGADLRGADLSEAEARSAGLFGANLSGADLNGALLFWANLDSADLRGADLRGADLSRAKLTKAKFDGAYYNENTRWPESFTPPPEAIKVGGESASTLAEVEEGEP